MFPLLSASLYLCGPLVCSSLLQRALRVRLSCLIPALRFALPVWTLRVFIACAESLTRILEDERSSDDFQPLPFHYIEIAALLFHANE